MEDIIESSQYEFQVTCVTIETMQGTSIGTRIITCTFSLVTINLNYSNLIIK